MYLCNLFGCVNLGEGGGGFDVVMCGVAQCLPPLGSFNV